VISWDSGPRRALSAPSATRIGCFELAAFHRDIQSLQARVATYDKASALLWQKGEKLETAVADTFSIAGFAVTQTIQGATYDLLVSDQTRPERLLIEVTGTDGGLSKGSRKISQVVDALQTEHKPGDRIVLALNAQINKPPPERSDVVTKDALSILGGLDVVIVLTPTLFDIWLLALT